VPRTAILLAIFLLIALIAHWLLSFILSVRANNALSAWLIFAAVVVTSMVNLLMVAWDRGNTIVVGDEAISFTSQRPNSSPLHLTFLYIEIASARELPPSTSFLPSTRSFDENSGTLSLFKNPWAENIEVTLNKPRTLRLTELKHLFVPRLSREEYVFGKLVFGAGDARICLRAILSHL
jgi:hypothetical protein